MEDWRIVTDLLKLLDLHLFNVGGAEITVMTVLWVTAATVLVVAGARWFGALTARRLLVRTNFDAGTRQAIASVVRYAVLAIGFLAIVQTIGLNLTTFNVLAGAFGVGIGFGLQNIISNFVSGLIIMLERPIKIGDRIELANFVGEVKEIGARRTTIVTDDQVAVLVPNQKFVTDNVINLAYWGSTVRVRLPVVVAATADPAIVEQILCDAARGNPGVLPDPPPQVRLLAIGANLSFELQAWSRAGQPRDALVSALNRSILAALRTRGIATG